MAGSIKAIKTARTALSERVEATSSGSVPTVQVSTEEMMLRFLAQRLYLSYDMVLEARAVFEEYCALDRAAQVTEGVAVEPASQTPLPTVAPASDNAAHKAEAGEKPGESEVLEETMTSCLAAESRDCIGVAGLRALFSDLGIVQSDIEIADLMDRLSGRVRDLDVDVCETSLNKPVLKRKINKQTALEDQRTLPKQKTTTPGISGGREKERGASISNAADSAQSFPVPQSGSSQNIKSSCLHTATVAPPPGLSFYHFLFLLQGDFHDSSEVQTARQEQEKEAAELFREMDIDHNGVLTESDIRQVLARLLTEETTFQDDETILRLASLHPVELQAALAEFDMDSDGHVTLSDFLSVLRS